MVDPSETGSLRREPFKGTRTLVKSLEWAARKLKESLLGMMVVLEPRKVKPGQLQKWYKAAGTRSSWLLETV